MFQAIGKWWTGQWVYVGAYTVEVTVHQPPLHRSPDRFSVGVMFFMDDRRRRKIVIPVNSETVKQAVRQSPSFEPVLAWVQGGDFPAKFNASTEREQLVKFLSALIDKDLIGEENE
jgi:hypothetical protein